MSHSASLVCKRCIGNGRTDADTNAQLVASEFDVKQIAKLVVVSAFLFITIFILKVFIVNLLVASVADVSHPVETELEHVSDWLLVE